MRGSHCDGTFIGQQGHEGVIYTFGPGKHHGPPDENWFTFVQVTDNGATLIKPYLSDLAP